MLVVLIFANATWAFLCLAFAMTIAGSGSIFSVQHFVLEGIYVGGLAAIEWTHRKKLSGVQQCAGLIT